MPITSFRPKYMNIRDQNHLIGDNKSQIYSQTNANEQKKNTEKHVKQDKNEQSVFIKGKDQLMASYIVLNYIAYMPKHSIHYA